MEVSGLTPRLFQLLSHTGNLKLTPLRYANVPPPMSLHELQLPRDAIDVHINSAIGSIAVLTINSIEVFSYKPKKGKVDEPEFLKSVPISSDYGTPRQVILTTSRNLAILCDGEDSRSQVLCYDTNDPDASFHHSRTLANNLVSNISTTLDDSLLYSQSDTGNIFPNGREASPHDGIPSKLPEYCPWTDAIQAEEFSLVIGLTRSGNLFVNDRLLSRNCTSFLTTTAHLIFTTSQHLLKFVHLATTEDLEVPPDEPEKDERCRSIERGARLITAIPSTYSLVLQMPRGNLETIYPRALVLAGIRKSIEKRDYRTAFLACRGHRVDMNIIHDHDPESFMKNVKLFVDQVQKVEHIDLFLSQLK
jgi:elongator complex protein 1